MSLVIYYLVMVALLTWLSVWSFKKGRRDVTIGDFVMILIICAIPFAGLVFAISAIAAFASNTVSSFLNKVLIKGDD